jgi:hypothetical protein
MLIFSELCDGERMKIERSSKDFRKQLRSEARMWGSLEVRSQELGDWLCGGMRMEIDGNLCESCGNLNRLLTFDEF